MHRRLGGKQRCNKGSFEVQPANKSVFLTSGQDFNLPGVAGLDPPSLEQVNALFSLQRAHQGLLPGASIVITAWKIRCFPHAL